MKGHVEYLLSNEVEYCQNNLKIDLYDFNES